MQGLIDFLFEPGVRAAHTDPHVVAAYEPVVVGDRAGTAVARTMLAMDLDNPRVMLVPEVTEKLVIHVTVTARRRRTGCSTRTLGAPSRSPSRSISASVRTPRVHR